MRVLPASYSLLISLSLVSCTSSSENETKNSSDAPAIQGETRWSEAWLVQERKRYLSDSHFRRAALLESLTNKENVYAQTRIESYGHGDRGWDLLPVWTPKISEIDSDYVENLRTGAATYLGEKAMPLWDGEYPTSAEGWVQLGRKVFYGYPLRSEIFADFALRNESIASLVGLSANAEGLWPGVIAFEDLEGQAVIGITCALCHVSIEEGKLVEGRARRDLDYGQMRVAFYDNSAATISDDLRRRMASWGPGRADITQDEQEDPVAIVDLWGLADMHYLTQSGTLTHEHPAALAIRQESQIIHANEERIRPPRALAWALSMYLYSLSPPSKDGPAPSVAKKNSIAHGQMIFGENCSHCHSGDAYAGPLVPVKSVGSDPALAKGQARGTGLYRPSPLIATAEAAPYLHDGTIPSLEAMLDPNRTIPGHRYGDNLGDSDKNALLDFLRSL